MKARREILRSIHGWRTRRSAVRRGASGPPPAPFVVGATRSGTTLLRLMLDAHPQIAIPSETHFIPELVSARDKHGATREQMLELLASHRRWGDFTIEPAELAERWAAIEPLTGADAVRAFFALYADKHGKHGARWGDKTPGYVKSMREIQGYLPEARFIHLIRDGRDVALSVLKQTWGPQSVEAAAEKWRSRVNRGRSQAPYLGYYLEVKFEDLILQTERELRRICEFIELDFDEDMLGYHLTAEQRLQEKARALPRAHGEAQSAEKRLMSHAKTFEPPNPDMIGTWRERMSPADRAAYEALAGDLLDELGYEVDGARGSGEVHTPRRGPRLPRPLRRAVAVAKHATGVSDPAEPRTPAPFLIGAARSGTDLLGAMMGAHSELAMLRETGFVPRLAEMIRSEPMTVERVIRVMAAAGPLEAHGLSEEEMRARLGALEDLKAAAVLRCFYEAAAESGGASRWGDDTPSYLKRMRRIQRALTEARFIHVVRDGRDTLAARPAEINAGAAIATGQRWNKKVRSVQVQAHLMNHLLEVRYEDLIADPERELRRVCEFIELPFEAGMASPPDRSRIEAALGPVGSWRERLEPDQLEAFEEVAGPMLDELGYREGAASAVR
ncbi:MAG: sulfotransferase [Solirubrobacterales bacterium]